MQFVCYNMLINQHVSVSKSSACKGLRKDVCNLFNINEDNFTFSYLALSLLLDGFRSHP